MKKIKYRMCLLLYLRYFTYIIYKTHMAKLIFKLYKKTDIIFLYNFFSLYKNVNRILSKKQKRFSKKACQRYQNLSEVEKDKNHQHTRKWYRNISKEQKERKRVYGRET